uniref:Cyclic nucleotide-binding domain-containing protein n=1 Tax=Panagrolaimus superbus TaxID=310955 RepID=A0A914XYF6_9BILA
MRALIHVSEIEHVEKKVIIEKGAIMKCLYIIVSGKVAKEGVQICDTERPVFGNALLEILFKRVNGGCDFDKIKADGIEIKNDSEISLVSPHATVLKIGLSDIYNIIKALDYERNFEETLAQFDHYIHVIAYLGSTKSGKMIMHPSMEDETQNVPQSPAPIVKFKEAYEITAIGDTFQESDNENKAKSPKKVKFSKDKVKEKIIIMDPKREQKTQLLEQKDSNSKKSGKKKQASNSRTPPTMAPNAAAAETDDDTVNEDKTQCSAMKPLL